MNFNVPQFIDIEDKIAFRLTAKQLGWFALGGVALFVVWNLFSKITFYISVPFVLGVAAVFSFYRPNNIPLIKFIFLGIVYTIRPKMYFWGKKIEKDIRRAPLEIKTKRKLADDPVVEKIRDKRLKEISSLVDILDHKSDL